MTKKRGFKPFFSYVLLKKKLNKFIMTEKIEKAKEIYKRHSRISFKVIKEFDDEIIIGINQLRSPSEQYATKERLEEIAKEVYKEVGKKIIVHAKPFVIAPAETVDGEWIKKKMNRYSIRSKQLVADLGLTESDISAIINGHKELGIRTKGLFYYYFMSRSINSEGVK